MTSRRNSFQTSEEEEEECRVCRGPAEKGRRLFTPCLCSGSIGRVHQDCLLSWLAVSRVRKCELCSSVFRFKPKYAKGAPEILSRMEVFVGSLRFAGKNWLPFCARYALVAVVWLVVLPLVTAYFYFGFLHRPSSLVSRMKLEFIAGDIVSGIVITLVIIVAFLSIISFADFLRIHWQQNHILPDDEEEFLEEMDAVNEEDLDDRERELEIEQNFRNANEGGLHRLLQPRVPRNVRNDVIRNDNEFENEQIQEQRNEIDDILNIDDFEFLRNRVEVGRAILGRDEAPNEQLNDILVQRRRLGNFGANRGNENDRNGMAMREGERVIAGNILGPNDQMNNERPVLPRRRQRDIAVANHDMENVPNVRARPDAPAVDEPRIAAAADQVEEMEIQLALDELLGIQGPLRLLFRNSMILISFNIAFLLLFAFVPYTVGGCVRITLLNSSAVHFLISTVIKKENIIWQCIASLNAESNRLNTILQLPDLIFIVHGYFCITFMVVLWITFSYVIINGIYGKQIPYRISVLLECAGAITKVCLLLSLKMILLPILIGICLDFATLDLYNSTLEERILFSANDIFTSLILHWVSGITFMLLVTVSVLQLREVVHPDLLAKVIRPQEPQPDLLKNFVEERCVTHAKRLLISLVVYALLLTFLIWLPSIILVHSGLNLWLPFFHPHFNYLVLPKLLAPIELLVTHLGFLAILEKNKNQIGNLQHQFLVFLTRKMNMIDFILPLNVEKFMYVGFRSLNFEIPSQEEFDRSKKTKDAKTDRRPFVDSFWKELSLCSNPSDDFIMSNVNLVDTKPPVFQKAITNRNGQRVLNASFSSIRIPYSKVEILTIPSCIGAYRIRRIKKSGVDIIEFWKEVTGEPISRPPEGWDDLGVGGAEIQGRWAWQDEKPSEIEEGVAKRKHFKESKCFCFFLFKLFFLLTSSWTVLCTTVIMALNTPLIIGRCVCCLLQIPPCYVHDTICAVIGFSTLYQTVMYLDFSQIDIRRWLKSFQPPVSKAKIYTLCSSLFLWYLLSPICCGIMYYFCFVMSHHEWANDTIPSFFALFKSWLSGLLILHVWGILCWFGVFRKEFWSRLFNFNENNVNNNYQTINHEETWQGKDGKIGNFFYILKVVFQNWEWDKIDEEHLLRNSMIPIIQELGLFVVETLITFIVIFSFLPVSNDYRQNFSIIGVLDYGRYRMFIFRIHALFVAATRLCVIFQFELNQWFKVAHNTIRNDRYLIGEELLDYVSEQK